MAAGAALLLAGTVSPLVGSAAAQTPGEAVLAPYGGTIKREYVAAAGRTGFLHKASGGQYLWTEYASGRSVPFQPPAGTVRIIDTHLDTVAFTTATAGEVLFVAPATGASHKVQLPAGFGLRSVAGDTVLASAGDTCHLFRLDAENQLTDRTVTGLPEGARCTWLPGSGIPSDAGDGTNAVLRYSTDEPAGAFGLVDLRSAEVAPLPVPAGGYPVGLQISSRAVAWRDQSTNVVHVVPRDGSKPAWTVPTTADGLSKTFGLVGDHLLWLNGGNGPVTAVAPDGTRTQVLRFGYGDSQGTVPGPDGSLLVFGVKGVGGDYAIHRFDENTDGTLTDEAVVTAPWYRSRTSSLALSHGRLATSDTYDGGSSSLHERKLALTGVPKAVTQEVLGSLGVCSSGGCPTPYPTGDGRVLYQVDGDTLGLVSKAKPVPGTTIELGTEATVLDVSGRYVAYRTATATEVRDLDTGKVVRTGSGSGPAALSGSTLWRPAGSGKVSAAEVATGTVSRTLSLGTSCSLGSLQVAGRYLYWECASAADGAGVIALADGKARPVRVTGHGMLGDGFVAYVGADRAVSVVDITAATPTVRTVGTARGTTASRDWTADASSDRVAFVDADENVHVVPTGTGAAPLAQTDAAVPTSSRVEIDNAFWRPRWWVSKPVASWTLTLRNKATGKTVRTLEGGESRGMITAEWDGWNGGSSTDVPGVPDAPYTWTLTARPADGQGAALTKTGTVAVHGARAALRDMVGRDGTGDLLTMNSSGAFTYQHGTGNGTFSGKTAASGWPTATVAVPFGDADSDGANETLVRTASGELRSCRTSGGALKPTTPYTKIGPGWNNYDSLVSPGDLTGDGLPDLLARNISTGDLYSYPGKSDGTLGTRKKIGPGWGGYTIIAAGDVGGDGIGDVFARRKDGTLFRYEGAGDGAWKPRVQMFRNWGNSYNVIVGAGDLTGDGRGDVIARDTSGNPYRYDGIAGGSFNPRVKIASGWNVYKGVF
ncbi:FG-GAP-like repeat-containing protein [Streptomyces sp. NPDC016845]|uniref:FG-GAP-like repeat-containing protein n=1 Tax=Streptomyces sp. NPDC016845 TaxID=3364972 RepID=UPI0037B6F896